MIRKLLLLGCFLSKLTLATPRPNIVVILADDLGYSDLGCYGGEIDTPHLDRLAENGVRFTQFYNTSRCCPSRASLLTGLYQHQAGIGHMTYGNWGDGYRANLIESVATFGEVLGTAGYQTMMTGKWHVGHSDPRARPEVRGFEKFTGIYSHVDSYWKVLKGCDIYRDGELFIPAQENPKNPYRPTEDFYTTEFFTDVAIDYIDQAMKDPSRPFLLHLCHNAPHFPLETPDELIKKYQGRYLKGWDILRQEKFERMKSMGLLPQSQLLPQVRGFDNKRIKGFAGTGFSTDLLPAWDSLSDKDRRELDFRRAMYAGQVDNLDQNIGRLVDHLEKRGILDNTLILFLSDNGCSGELGLFGMNWGKHREENYGTWKRKSGWSISQGQCWAAFSNTPFRKYKKFTHEGGIATPLIAHWPEGIKNSGRIETRQIGHLIDIMPTLIDVADVKYPKNLKGHTIPPMEGVSLLPLIRSPNAEPVSNRTIYWQHETHAAIRDGDWKLVADNDRSPEGWQLYDLSRDRSETDDLAALHPEKATTLYRKWEAWAKRVNAIPFPEDRERGNTPEGKSTKRALKTGKLTLTTSHCYSNDTLEAILADRAPLNSSDKSKPKHTFWPHRGTEETMNLEFGEFRTIRGSKVYWFDDTGDGACRIPESWSLEYSDGTKWRPIKTAVPCETRRDAFNQVNFEPVNATALRMKVKLRKNFSGGVLRWLPLFASSRGNVKTTPPNIVHLIADDLGWGDVGFHRSGISTPHLDRLARESVVLDRFYVAPICSPTRAGALTGRYPWRFGIWGGVCSPTARHGLPPDETTVPELLAGAGYQHRALLGKWHLGLASDIFHPLNHGFTKFYGHYNGAIDYFSRERFGQLDWHRNRESAHEEGYSTDLLGTEAARFVRETEGPFYLLVAFNAPHSPLQAKPDDLAAVGFDPTGPRAPNTDARIARREKDPDYGEAGKGNDKRQTFTAMTRAMDRNIGRILEALDTSGKADNTLLIFHSDNGADPRHGGSNKPLRGTKFTTWEGGTRVVAMLRWPTQLKGGCTFEQPAAYIDLFPTFAAAAGASIPDQVDGVNLLPLITGESGSTNRVLLLDKETALSGGWKLMGNELFDLTTDPGETRNLAPSHPEQVRRIRKALKQFPTMQGPRFTTKLPAPAQWPPHEWKLPKEP
ncbi:MAG: sulfatase-like hydrolase/transferase [Akkermansiaceae bacterium]